MISESNHIFISKSVFFPGYGILAIGDLHVGYEHALVKSGILIPEQQVTGIIEELRKIILEIKNKGFVLKKIIFLGDIKHFFNYEWKEKFNFNKILEFLRTFVKDSDIILIKGNHDKFDFSGKKMKNYYIKNGIAFFHGHMNFPQVLEKEIKTWVIGHLHPSIILSDKAEVKREKYKCFLVGKFNKREVIIAPSFFGIIEGSALNDERYYPEEGFSVVSPKELKKFEVFAINDNGEILNFGKIGKLK